jgi:predicted Zn-ribbon and HTH transcriptional regulator
MNMKRVMIIALALCAFGVFAYGQEMKMHHKYDSTKAEKHIAPEKQGAKAATNLYTCPMHADVTSDKPGKCPKCKMDLVKKEVGKVQSAKDVYACPMHSDVKSNKPGKCPKCKMDLVKEKKEK